MLYLSWLLQFVPCGKVTLQRSQPMRGLVKQLFLIGASSWAPNHCCTISVKDSILWLPFKWDASFEDGYQLEHWPNSQTIDTCPTVLWRCVLVRVGILRPSHGCNRNGYCVADLAGISQASSRSRRTYWGTFPITHLRQAEVTTLHNSAITTYVDVP